MTAAWRLGFEIVAAPLTILVGAAARRSDNLSANQIPPAPFRFFGGATCIGRIAMVLVVFAILAAIGQVLNVFLCLALDQIFSPAVGGTAFVLFYMLVFAAAWILSVWIVERWLGQAAGEQRPQRQVLQTSAR
jgi:hypothetical protein